MEVSPKTPTDSLSFDSRSPLPLSLLRRNIFLRELDLRVGNFPAKMFFPNLLLRDFAPPLPLSRFGSSPGILLREEVPSSFSSS